MARVDLKEYVRQAVPTPGEEQDRFRQMLGNEWEASQGLFEREDLGRLISPDAIRRALVGMRLEPGDYAPALESVARRVAKDPLFARLWEHCWHLAYRSEPLERWSEKQWQPFRQYLGDQVGEFFLSVLLSHYDCLMEIVQARSIPVEIVSATLAMVTSGIRKDTAQLGRAALTAIYWPANHLAGRVFRLGRLSYTPRPFKGKLTVYRNRRSGRTVSVPLPDLTFRSDGQFDGAGGRHDPEGAWETQVHQRGGALVSNAWISPLGCARREDIRLDLAEWEAMLKPGDQTLEFHIPGGEPLDHAACGESFRWSLEFFAKHFPEITPRAIHSGGWWSDPQLQDMLPATANLVRFQREMYLYPTMYSKGSEKHILGCDYKNLDDAPQRTALQQAIVRHLRAGGQMMAAECFMLAKDVAADCWGTQRYINTAGP